MQKAVIAAEIDINRITDCFCEKGLQNNFLIFYKPPEFDSYLSSNPSYWEIAFHADLIFDNSSEVWTLWQYNIRVAM